MTKKLNVITLLIVFYSVGVCSYFDYTNKRDAAIVSTSNVKENKKKQIVASTNDNGLFPLITISTRK